MSFVESLQKSTNKTLTENGAVTNSSTLDPVLDFFSRAGAMRNNINNAVSLFVDAYNADKQLAVKTLFYLRDIRGGQGERAVFRACLDKWFKIDPDTATKLIKLVPEYGRWDDLLNSNISLDVLAPIIREQLLRDVSSMRKGENISLLAKWLPSENATSLRSRKMARLIAEKTGITYYRKLTTSLRKYIKLLEQDMSKREWGSIQYDKIPSQALRKHTKAFNRHDESRFTRFLEDVKNGDKKINTSTLYTYEVYDMVRNGQASEADVVWNNLPDFTNDVNALVLADVSGSMSGRPMSISVSLALYFAERNKGAFNGYYMTFTDTPRLVKVQNGTIAQKMSFIEGHNVGYNTNLAKAFDAILEAAVNDKVSQEELPKVLYIISDMEFDDQMSGNKETNFETAKRKFNEAGYELPHVVFWNVNARNMQSPATKFDDKVTLISGSSQSTFKYAVAGKTPLESMYDILNSERYATIVV